MALSFVTNGLRRRLVTVGLLLTLLGAFVAAPLSAGAAPPNQGGTATLYDTAGNVLGTVTNLTASRGQTGEVLVNGTFTDTAGNVTDFTTNLLDASGSCPILHLELGPLDLNLLGLMVHLDRVVLDITAQSGPGNLLGNLLCGVANLLNSNAPNTSLVNLLNQIFGLLG